jgi:hypothetical protein
MRKRVGKLVLSERALLTRQTVTWWLAEYVFKVRDILKFPLIREVLESLGNFIPDKGRAIDYNPDFERGKNFMRFRLIEWLTKKYNDGAKEKS